jgi:uncharacterized protein YndB with AHSA1/START domain
MTDTTRKSVIAADNDAVVTETYVDAPPERVFKALTDATELGRWFTNPECQAKFWQMDARPGGRYGYTTEKGSVVVNGANEFECHGEILEFVPERLLVYTWVASWHVDKTRQTVVSWELTPQRGGTHVKVTHSGLAEEEAARKDYSGGWIGMLEMLRKFCETRPRVEDLLSLI